MPDFTDEVIVAIDVTDLPLDVEGIAKAYPDTDLFYGFIAERGFPTYAREAWSQYTPGMRERALQKAVQRLFITGPEDEGHRLTLAFYDAVGIDLRF